MRFLVWILDHGQFPTADIISSTIAGAPKTSPMPRTTAPAVNHERRPGKGKKAEADNRDDRQQPPERSGDEVHDHLHRGFERRKGLVGCLCHGDVAGKKL